MSGHAISRKLNFLLFKSNKIVMNWMLCSTKLPRNKTVITQAAIPRSFWKLLVLKYIFWEQP